jgi:hypothetical protein
MFAMPTPGYGVLETISCEKSAAVRARPDRSWNLLSSTAVFALIPGAWMMFDVPGPDRVRFLLGPASRADKCTIYRVGEEVSGERIRLDGAFGTAIALSLAETRRGRALVTISYSQKARPERAVVARQQLHDRVRGWLRAVEAVLEERAPWPAVDQMPDALRLVHADLPAVWDVVYQPAHSGAVIASGFVPDTPRSEAGEMQYTVTPRKQDGVLVGRVYAASSIRPPREAHAHEVNPPYFRFGYCLAEDPAGTRLELTFTGPSAAMPDGQDGSMAEHFLRAALDHAKALAEGSPGGGGEAAADG